MQIELIIGLVGLLGMWTSLWYKIGKIEDRAKGNSDRLERIESILNGRYNHARGK